MRTRSQPPRPMAALPALVLLLAVGCEEPRNAGGKKAAAPPPPKDNFIVGKRTQDIKEATPEATQGSQQANMKITAKDPITLSGNAYVTSVGRVAMMRIEDAMRKFQAANDRYPKDYDEFMNGVIKENGIALPALPFYQEYFYDANEHKLMIREYPDRKAGPLPQ